MSDPNEDAWAACTAAIKAVDASLSVLVVCRENIVNAMKAIQAAEAEPERREDPFAAMGQEPDPDCQHPEDSRLDLPGGAQLCEACGEQVT
jgi:hypothetical protein